jgi:hypothetical protein
MTTVTVEVDIFSGMPNPVWTLSEAAAAAYLSKLSELSRTAARQRSGKLGYRGLVVRMPEQPGRIVYIQDGVVESDDGTSRTFFRDQQRSLERWLIGTGEELLDRAALSAIDADMRT